ncbi:zinc transporter 6-A-like isoform X3 [Athalia rosae]|uniref:zinc transporter 6-A-like isoform X3 n=1 Tax=Athalia rosae TaxID=37344 RepID=UPI002034700C|nr:zinc transporter 6-A-like isoform X3 [Athalia rosae]
MRIFAGESGNDCSNDAESNAKNGKTEENGETRAWKIQILKLFGDRKSKWILCLIGYNSAIVYELSTWTTSTNSLALRAYVNTILFNTFALFVCLVSVWVSQNLPDRPPKDDEEPVNKPASNHSRSNSTSGYPQYQKNFTSHFPRHSISGPCLFKDGTNAHRLQENVSKVAPLSILGLEKYEVLALLVSSCLAIAAASLIALEALSRIKDQPIIHTDTHVADTAAALALVALATASMLPLAFYTASIILQKLPHYMGEQLDKCLREALNIDGVLEFRNERFWTQSFGKLAGTVQVRIRRDANESHVLERVMAGLSQIVTTLTVQEFRETPRANLGSQHCTEYYINELLPNAGENKAARVPRSNVDEVETVSIDDILGVEKTPVSTFSLAPNKSERKCSTSYSNPAVSSKMLTIYHNENLDLKHYIFNPRKAMNENALLLRSNFDEEKFTSCALGRGENWRAGLT